MHLLSSLHRLIADPDVAIDLGTANTRVVAHGQGLVGVYPSLVEPREGARADKHEGIAPLRAGVVVDVDAAASLLRLALRSARRLGLTRPRVLVGAPTDASEDERAALVEATHRAGASAVEIVPEPLAAAIGAGLDVGGPYAQMVVDIGHGVTDMAVIRSGAIVATAAVRIACRDLHAAVRDWVESHHGVRLEFQEAEWLTNAIGTIAARHRRPALEAIGIDCSSKREVMIPPASTQEGSVAGRRLWNESSRTGARRSRRNWLSEPKSAIDSANDCCGLLRSSTTTESAPARNATR